VDELFDQAAALELEGKGAEAVRAYTRAARSGNGRAAKRLGEIYDKGVPGVSRDYAESLKWYNTARALGEDIKDARRGGDGHNPDIEPQKDAPRSAGRLYDQAAELERSGKGSEAVYVYRRAARSGDGKAANRLGEIYGQGIPGVDSNYAESLKWCNTARALGETPNCAAH
jgi:TPR repeat protein